MAPRFSRRCKPVTDLGGHRRRTSWCSSCTCGSGGSPGPTSSGCRRGPTDPPMYMKVPLMANGDRAVGRPAVRDLVVHRQALASRAENHARRHAAGVDGPDVLPGSVAQLLQHVVHLQHLAVQPGLLVIGHSRDGCRPRNRAARCAEPLLTNAPGYAYGVLLITIVGCWVMRKIKARWPNISNLRLILVTYAFAFVLDFVMEAWSMLPIGLYTYPGAIRAVSFNRRHLLPVADLRRADVGRRPGGAVLSALLHRRSRPHDRRTRTGPCPGRIRRAAVHPLPGDLRRGQRVLLLLLQRSRAMDRHALRPLARGPHEALVLHRRHLRRRDRRAVPRPCSADAHQAVRLHQHRRRTCSCRRARRFRQVVPFEPGS